MGTRHAKKAARIVGLVKPPPLINANSQENHGKSVLPSIARQRE